MTAFLSDFSIDQLLRPIGSPFERRAAEIFRSMARAETVTKYSTFSDWLASLPPVNWTRLDTSSGLMRLEAEESVRRFQGDMEMDGRTWTIGLELAPRVEGGYWRTPAVIQVAFWRGQRVRFVAKGQDGSKIDSEIDCASVSVDGIRIHTADESTPDVLVSFDACP